MCENKSLIIIILQVDEQVVDNAYFALIEAVCIAWFTLEYFLRLAGRSLGEYTPLDIIETVCVISSKFAILVTCE